MSGTPAACNTVKLRQGALSLISDVVTGSCRCPNISYFEFLAASDINRLSVTAPDTTCPNVRMRTAGQNARARNLW